MDSNFLAYFKLVHGFFNLCMFCLFCYQGVLGLRIRKARLAGREFPGDAVRRHRTLGPVFALWGCLGFVAGVTLVLLDKGKVWEYPLHFLAGSAIVLTVLALYRVSRRIRAGSASSRDVHFGLGMLLLSLYVIQCFLGLSILL